ncbi:MAG: DUF202 domain-containing protein [Deltaproteobacteria bacterium]|nr:DUF202 domain-containing protein [Deltaproteobacteria bacterium]
MEDKTTSRVLNRRVHMANERTFLAWIRTSIGIMAFGFVVVKFALFIKQIGALLATSGFPEMHVVQPPHGSSSFFGIALVGLGALMGVLAFIRYKKVEKQIDEDMYQPSLILDILLTLSVLAVGIFLVIYLIHNTSGFLT